MSIVTPRTRRRSRTAPLCAGAGVVLALAAAAALGHDLAPRPVRELVRIQGYRAPAPPGVPATREVTLVVLGGRVPFAASEWRSFAFFDASDHPTPVEPAQVTLQGERPSLHSITSARPDQRITILAERRPGSSDMFVLSVDLCPPQ